MLAEVEAWFKTLQQVPGCYAVYCDKCNTQLSPIIESEFDLHFHGHCVKEREAHPPPPNLEFELMARGFRPQAAEPSPPASEPTKCDECKMPLTTDNLLPYFNRHIHCPTASEAQNDCEEIDAIRAMAWNRQPEPCKECGWTPKYGEIGIKHDCKPEAASGTAELRLLVIDMGTECVIRVEKLGKSFSHVPVQGLFTIDGVTEVYCNEGESDLVHRSLADVKAAIGGEKPVPRIERLPNGNYNLFTNADAPSLLFVDDYIALTSLNNGRPLPIYQLGKWTQLVNDRLFVGMIDNEDEDWIDAPCQIWRYER